MPRDLRRIQACAGTVQMPAHAWIPLGTGLHVWPIARQCHGGSCITNGIPKFGRVARKAVKSASVASTTRRDYFKLTFRLQLQMQLMPATGWEHMATAAGSRVHSRHRLALLVAPCLHHQLGLQANTHAASRQRSLPRVCHLGTGLMHMVMTVPWTPA